MSGPEFDPIDDAFARAINAIDDAMLLVRQLKQNATSIPQSRIATQPDLEHPSGDHEGGDSP